MMSKTFWKKVKIGFLTLSTMGLLAACNTTDEFEENPDMGPPSTEEPAEEAPAGGNEGGETEAVE